MSLTVLRRSAIAAWLFLALAPTAANAALLQQTTLSVPGVQSGVGSVLSADGNTALLSGYTVTPWVFVRDGQSWARLGQLIPADATSPLHYGTVALSGDGTVAVVGTPEQDKTPGRYEDGARAPGAAYVFTRASTGAWTQEAKLTGSGCAARPVFGNAVAISRDGSTIAVGAPADCGNGSAWIYRHTPGGWALAHALQTGTTDNGARSTEAVGGDVAVDGDGSTVLVGSLDRVYVLGRGADGSWSVEDGAPVAQDDWDHTGMGFGVALSDDGRAALVDGTDNPRLFSRTDRASTAWTQLGTRMVPFGPVVGGSTATALSGDGSTALLGYPGASAQVPGGVAATYLRTPMGWAAGERLAGAADMLGAGATVTLSRDGSTVMLGGFENRVPVFERIPTVTATAPATGLAAGGTTITLTGTDFTGATAVVFGRTKAPSFSVIAPDRLTAVVPPAARAGAVPITVVGTRGTSPSSPAATFTYVRPLVVLLASAIGRVHPAVRVGCAVTACHGTASLRSIAGRRGHKSTTIVARGTFTVAAGHTKAVVLRPTSAGRRLLARTRGRTLHLTARVVVGGARPVSRRVTLR